MLRDIPDGIHWIVPVEVRELNEIDGHLEQVMLVRIVCASEAIRKDTVHQALHNQELHPACENNLPASELVPYYTKV